MLSGLAGAFVLAIIAALVLGGVTWLWKLARPWLRMKALLRRAWFRLSRDQITEIQELRKDVDALLNVLDHWVTPNPDYQLGKTTEHRSQDRRAAITTDRERPRLPLVHRD